LGIYQLIKHSLDEDRNFEEKLKYFNEPEKFRLLIEKEKIKGITKSKLKQIIKRSEHYHKIQSEIKKSIEIQKIVDTRSRQRTQKENFFAFSNLSIIREI